MNLSARVTIKFRARNVTFDIARLDLGEVWEGEGELWNIRYQDSAIGGADHVFN